LTLDFLHVSLSQCQTDRGAADGIPVFHYGGYYGHTETHFLPKPAQGGDITFMVSAQGEVGTDYQPTHAESGPQ
jgi:hypothetical protein